MDTLLGTEGRRKYARNSDYSRDLLTAQSINWRVGLQYQKQSTEFICSIVLSSPVDLSLLDHRWWKLL